MCKLYWDRFAKEYVTERSEYAPPERYTLMFESPNEGMYMITYKSSKDANKAITFCYTKESLNYIPYEKQLKEFLMGHGLTIDDIQPWPWMWYVPPSEYEAALKEAKE